MDYRPDPTLPFARRAGALALDPAPSVPIRFAPPRGEGRRLPARRDEARAPSRKSRRRRRSIVEVNAAIAAVPPLAPATERVPARWARFEALVLEAGVPRERLLAAFPTAEDIEDIFHTPDADLAGCAATLAAALLGDAPAAREPAPSAVPGTVRCGECRHFARSATHPRLGLCGAGEAASAAGGWWDTQPRRCASFERAPDARAVPPPR